MVAVCDRLEYRPDLLLNVLSTVSYIGENFTSVAFRDTVKFPPRRIDFTRVSLDITINIQDVY